MNRVIQTKDVLRRSALVLAIAVTIGCKSRQPLPTVRPAVARPRPLRIAIFIDQTRSMTVARVGPLSTAVLAPLYERLEVSGGEIAVGAIRDRSNAPLVRLFIAPPPEAPATGPLPSNVFHAAAARTREAAERNRYETLRRAWQSEANARVSAFEAAVAPLLAADDDAPRTDIRSALARADVFLSEPTVYPRAAQNTVILVTDGADNVSPKPLPTLTAPAELVVVNGTGEVHSLAVLHPLRFEAIDAAVRFAVGKGDHHAND